MPPLLYRSSWRAQFIKDKNNIIFTVLLTLWNSYNEGST
jgi:hypothetical protein